MAGMNDETGGGGQARCLADDHLPALQSMIDEGMAALMAMPLKPGEVLAVERKTRAVGAMARTIKLVDGLRRKPAKASCDDNEDQDMSDDQTGRGDDMDPAEVAAVRAELDSRLDWIRAVIEKKRLAGRAEPEAIEGPAGPDAKAA